ncbi:hypothetical protein [Acidiphilium sp. JA12-A1]|uniref:hypothetical protein n=1 Tax=Acidiphilium sp. JA12-A1 TaxID=1464546 RepID=UPI00128EF14D|nr:hypothetical protein [Acidiphilium sp. JA12-A1]
MHSLQMIQKLQSLDFDGKGEAFVESRFLSPLLEALGYETHRDYEVVRHGDDGSAFKLHYPPVESGAQRVKHYHPDYIPTIRKKMFWIIEAKSPKDVTFPFDQKYLVQGFQYCIHPEIQAKYLLVTTGAHSAVYDAHSAVFLGQDIYQPILVFQAFELISRWEEIFNLLSVEKLRSRIESDLKTMYDKLCLSSLDKTYPSRLIGTIGLSATDNARKIEENVRNLSISEISHARKAWIEDLKQRDTATLFANMDCPLQPTGLQVEGYYFVVNSLTEGTSPRDLFEKLTKDFEQHRIFRKMQTLIALCALYRRTDDEELKARCEEFFAEHADEDLPLLNQVECAAIRLRRKIGTVALYPPLAERLRQQLMTAPELVRFVNPPNVAGQLYEWEIIEAFKTFEAVKVLKDEQLRRALDDLLEKEQAIELDFQTAYIALPDSEKLMDGFAGYGAGGKNPGFRNILSVCGLEPPS